jgi:hypothetical protein
VVGRCVLRVEAPSEPGLPAWTLAQQRHPLKISLGLSDHFTSPNKTIFASVIFFLGLMATRIEVNSNDFILKG